MIPKPEMRLLQRTSSHRKTMYQVLGRDPVHPFPARMAPGLVLDILAGTSGKRCVLDPMAGSGTVLALARFKGHVAIGVDIDPLAVLIARVWTTAIDPSGVREKAHEVLDCAKYAFERLSVGRAYPSRADEETKKFLRYWFDEYARRQLAALAAAISRVHDDVTRDVLWCCLSRLIITKQAGASLAMDLSHSRPHKSFQRAPAKPFRNWLTTVNRVVENCLSGSAKGRGPATRVCEGDARALPLPDSSVDLVLTSPPYLNAIDYMRCSKFSLVWMGRSISELRDLRARSVGTEVGSLDACRNPQVRRVLADLKLRPQLGPGDQSVLCRYIADIKTSLSEVARVLKPDGKAVYVVGENTVRGTYVRNSAIVAALAEMCGLRLLESRIRMLPPSRRYLPPPSSLNGKALDGRMRREVVLAFAA